MKKIIILMFIMIAFATNVYGVEVVYSDSVDGDTAKFIMDGEKVTVRFLGIDTPETVHPTKEIEAYGKEASDYTKDRLQNATKIELEFDEKAGQKDRYNRYLAWIKVDGQLLQEELIKKGLAKTYMLPNTYMYASLLKETEKTAQELKIGMWNEEIVASTDTNTVTNTMANTVDEESFSEEASIISLIFLVLLGIVSYLVKGKKKGRKKKFKIKL